MFWSYEKYYYVMCVFMPLYICLVLYHLETTTRVNLKFYVVFFGIFSLCFDSLDKYLWSAFQGFLLWSFQVKFISFIFLKRNLSPFFLEYQVSLNWFVLNDWEESSYNLYSSRWLLSGNPLTTAPRWHMDYCTLNLQTDMY